MTWGLARSFFLLAGMAVATSAAYAWYQPGSRVISSLSEAGPRCTLPLNRAQARSGTEPDSDLIWLLFGLSQGVYRS